MNPEQRTVALGAAIGVLGMATLVAALYAILPVVPGMDAPLDRLVFALRLHAFSLLPLFVMLAAVGNRRFLTEAIDPLRNIEDRATDINRRMATNTLEQTLVFIIATLALSTYLTSSSIRLMPALVATFVLARIVFWIGYRIHPLYRATGMAATTYLNLGVILAVLYLLIFA